MAEKRPVYKTRVRSRGQITLPSKVRQLFHIKEGDDLMFYTNKQGQLVVQPAPEIDPDQVWFWSEHWQKMEREVDEDYAAGRYKDYDNVEDLIEDLNKAWRDANSSEDETV